MELAGKIPITFLCNYFNCSRSGYYSWAKNTFQAIETKSQARKRKVIRAFSEANGRYGSPRLHKILIRKNIQICENTVAKIMKEEGLVARKKKKFKLHIVKEKELDPVADRLFKIEDKEIFEKNKLWVGDITYIPFDNKFLYLSVVLDVARRKVVGWSLDQNLSSEGVIKALRNAHEREGCVGSIFHSDQGVQYKSRAFRAVLKEMGIKASMSRRGNCYDNAYVETFFKSFKSELLWNEGFASEENLCFKIFKYIEIFYNRERLHSALDYKSPMEYELGKLAA